MRVLLLFCVILFTIGVSAQRRPTKVDSPSAEPPPQRSITNRGRAKFTSSPEFAEIADDPEITKPRTNKPAARRRLDYERHLEPRQRSQDASPRKQGSYEVQEMVDDIPREVKRPILRPRPEQIQREADTVKPVETSTVETKTEEISSTEPATSTQNADLLITTKLFTPETDELPEISKLSKEPAPVSELSEEPKRTLPRSQLKSRANTRIEEPSTTTRAARTRPTRKPESTTTTTTARTRSNFRRRPVSAEPIAHEIPRKGPSVFTESEYPVRSRTGRKILEHQKFSRRSDSSVEDSRESYRRSGIESAASRRRETVVAAENQALDNSNQLRRGRIETTTRKTSRRIPQIDETKLEVLPLFESETKTEKFTAVDNIPEISKIPESTTPLTTSSTVASTSEPTTVKPRNGRRIPTRPPVREVKNNKIEEPKPRTGRRQQSTTTVASRSRTRTSTEASVTPRGRSRTRTQPKKVEPTVNENRLQNLATRRTPLTRRTSSTTTTTTTPKSSAKVSSTSSPKSSTSSPKSSTSSPSSRSLSRGNSRFNKMEDELVSSEESPKNVKVDEAVTQAPKRSRNTKRGTTKDHSELTSSEEAIDDEDNYPEPFKALIQAKIKNKDSRPRTEEVSVSVSSSVERQPAPRSTASSQTTTTRSTTPTERNHKPEEDNELHVLNTPLKPLPRRPIPRTSSPPTKPKPKVPPSAKTPPKSSTPPPPSTSTTKEVLTSISSKVTRQRFHARFKAETKTPSNKTVTPSGGNLDRNRTSRAKPRNFGGPTTLKAATGVYSSKKGARSTVAPPKEFKRGYQPRGNAVFDNVASTTEAPHPPQKSRFSAKYRSDLLRATGFKASPAPAYVPTVPYVSSSTTTAVITEENELGMEIISLDEPVRVSIPSANLIRDDYLQTPDNKTLHDGPLTRREPLDALSQTSEDDNSSSQGKTMSSSTSLPSLDDVLSGKIVDGTTTGRVMYKTLEIDPLTLQVKTDRPGQVSGSAGNTVFRWKPVTAPPIVEIGNKINSEINVEGSASSTPPTNVVAITPSTSTTTQRPPPSSSSTTTTTTQKQPSSTTTTTTTQRQPSSSSTTTTQRQPSSSSTTTRRVVTSTTPRVTTILMDIMEQMRQNLRAAIQVSPTTTMESATAAPTTIVYTTTGAPSTTMRPTTQVPTTRAPTTTQATTMRTTTTEATTTEATTTPVPTTTRPPTTTQVPTTTQPPTTTTRAPTTTTRVPTTTRAPTTTTRARTTMPTTIPPTTMRRTRPPTTTVQIEPLIRGRGSRRFFTTTVPTTIASTTTTEAPATTIGSSILLAKIQASTEAERITITPEPEFEIVTPESVQISSTTARTISSTLKTLTAEQKKNLETLAELEREQAAILKQLSFLTNLIPGGPKSLGKSTTSRPSRESATSINSILESLNGIQSSTKRPSTFNLLDAFSQTTTKQVKPTNPQLDQILRQYDLSTLKTTTKRPTTSSLFDIISTTTDKQKSKESTQAQIEQLLKQMTSTSTAPSTTKKTTESLFDVLATRTKQQTTTTQSEEQLAELLKRYNVQGVQVASSTQPTVSTPYGKSNDAILAAILKEQGIGPNTPRLDIVRQLQAAATRPPTTTPRPGMIMQGLNWLLNRLAPVQPPRRPVETNTEEIMTRQPTRLTPVVYDGPNSIPSSTIRPRSLPSDLQQQEQREISVLLQQIQAIQKDPQAAQNIVKQFTGKNSQTYVPGRKGELSAQELVVLLKEVQAIQNDPNKAKNVQRVIKGEVVTTTRKTTTTTTTTRRPTTRRTTSPPKKSLNDLSPSELTALLQQVQALQQNNQNIDLSQFLGPSPSSEDDDYTIPTRKPTRSPRVEPPRASPQSLDYEEPTRKPALPPVAFRPVVGVPDGDPALRGRLVNAAVSVTRAFTSFLGNALQGATNAFSTLVSTSGASRGYAS